MHSAYFEHSKETLPPIKNNLQKTVAIASYICYNSGVKWSNMSIFLNSIRQEADVSWVKLCNN